MDEASPVIAVGVDAYRSGWIAIALADGRFQSTHLFADVRTVLQAFPEADAVGIDIPLTFPSSESRRSELEARAYVGARRASVFRTFPREVYEAQSHAEAVVVARRLTTAGISQQSYGLGQRILEAEELARREERLIEVHPEASFRAMAGRELDFSKRSWNGLTERRRLVAAAEIDLPDRLEGGHAAAPDDVADAGAAAWSAHRYAMGNGMSLPNGQKRLGAIWC